VPARRSLQPNGSADAGLTGHQPDSAPALGRLIEPLDQLGLLASPPDHRCRAARFFRRQFTSTAPSFRLSLKIDLVEV
jgi:hypothetical protein